MIELEAPERKRTYVYHARVLAIADVALVRVDSEGYHYLESTDGRKHVVAPGWIAIEIEADEWPQVDA